eukprot:CAMPEP_0197006548 /NCGR_PEP_ID=MMETSP1380-20130617/35580_1 /TAXON_ID=5936 /ORGANISM="Euplotes crassus, Strain CT5" /LENGTH=93 /DNA_ID=CAMNT_0042426165 /DNA_START=9 /DNA_END=287 /DNA_ORIENTATION=+
MYNNGGYPQGQPMQAPQPGYATGQPIYADPKPEYYPGQPAPPVYQPAPMQMMGPGPQRSANVYGMTQSIACSCPNCSASITTRTTAKISMTQW